MTTPKKAKAADITPLPGIDPLALLQEMVKAASGEVEVVEADLPVPPTGASARAQATWYAVLKEYGPLPLSKMRTLEQIADTQSDYDRVRDEWETTQGRATTSKGSMGQEVESPALATMRALRTQEAALWKALDLGPDEGGRRRPGRPTRLEAAQRGRASRWGTR